MRIGGWIGNTSNNQPFTNVGRTKLIETPEFMWELFEAYVAEVKSNPKLKNDFAGKDADEVVKKLERPLTMEGFECYVFKSGYNSELSYYFANRDGKYQDYLPICNQIRKAIRNDQIEGGMVGIYNASITQRLNNLVERVQEDGSKEVVVKVKYERKGSTTNPE